MTDMIFNEKTRQELEGLLPCAVCVTKTFKPTSIFEGKVQKYCPSFQLSGITMGDMDRIKALSKYAKDIGQIDIQETYKFVAAHVKGWDNLFDIANNTEIKYSDENRELVVGSFPVGLIVAIQEELYNMAGITEREKQNLTS